MVLKTKFLTTQRKVIQSALGDAVQYGGKQNREGKETMPRAKEGGMLFQKNGLEELKRDGTTSDSKGLGRGIADA